MPITVNCQCGKVFKVKDEVAGTTIQCQVCGKQISVPAQGAVLATAGLPERPPIAVAPPPVIRTVPIPVEPVAPPPAIAGIATMACPSCAEKIPGYCTECPFCGGEVTPQSAAGMVKCLSCAENIPRLTLFCPFCGEKPAFKLTAAECDELLKKRLAQLDEHLANPATLEADATLRGGQYFLSLKICAAIEAGSVLLILAGFVVGRDLSDALKVFGTLGLVFTTIPLLWIAYNNYISNHIQDCKDPVRVIKRFFSMALTSRANRAYLCVLPMGRNFGPVESVRFNDGSMPTVPGKFTVKDFAEFKAYWKSIARVSFLHNRGVRFVKAKSILAQDDLAVVEATFEFTSMNPAFLLLGVLIATMMQKKETKIVRKLLVKHNNLWYLAEGEFEGRLDTASRPAL